MRYLIMTGRMIEALLLRGLPAVALFATFDHYRIIGLSGRNENAGVFVFLAMAWLGGGPKLQGHAAGILRWREWLWALLFVVVTQAVGTLFIEIWRVPWAGLWIFLISLFILAGGQPDEKPGAKTPPAPGQPPVSAPPAPAKPARPPLRLGAKIALAVLGLGLMGGGMVAFLFTGPPGRLRWTAITTRFGTADEMQALGWRYREGDGAPQDFGEAAKWFERAAQKGSARAQYDLGVLCYYGLGRPADPERARGYLEQAAGQDYPAAATFLGLMARDTDQDQERAMAFWKTAAEAGDPWAEYLLGTAFLARRGADEGNLIMALYWLELARRDGVEPIKGLLQHVWATVPDEDQDYVTDEVFNRLDGLPAETTPPEPVATTTP